jgi:hypothetical protein
MTAAAIRTATGTATTLNPKPYTLNNSSDRNSARSSATTTICPSFTTNMRE